ncbi:MAG: FKBP-type peptidyl-prolyl cis-trans isomerase [Fimbriimonadales bacterium]
MKLTGLAFLSCLLIAGCSGSKTATGGNSAGGAPVKPSAPPKVTTTDLAVGKGKQVAATGDTVWMLYRGTITNGPEFDSNMAEGKDLYSFTLGEGHVIKGWDLGIPGMRVGGERKLHIPAALAYGPQGRGDKIPPNSDLDFDVKLLGIVKAGEDVVIDKTDVKVGKGREVKAGDTVTIQYVGSLPTGKVFEDSHNFPEPYSFTVGKGTMLPCLDAGVVGMKVGGVRDIIAPPKTAYVMRLPAGVPYNSIVHFEVTLLSIK